MDALKGDEIEAEFERSKGKRIETGDREGVGGDETRAGDLIVFGRGKVEGGRWRKGQIGAGGGDGAEAGA